MEQLVPTINVRGRLISLDKPIVMGILNITPDSFYDGSRKQTEGEIANRANEIIEQGGEIIDIGAFSTRPGASEVTEQEEMQRLRMGLQIVRREQPEAIISIDTYRPDVAKMCHEEFGADIINDVSEGGLMGITGVSLPQTGAQVPAMFEMMGKLKIPYILMSTKNSISAMLQSASQEIAMLRELGVNDIIFDPGFGFGKTLDENYAILGDMEKLQALDVPLLVGVSRKSMITRFLDINTSDALNGTTAIHTIALQKGAHILRVHDVREAWQTVQIVQKINQQ